MIRPHWIVLATLSIGALELHAQSRPPVPARASSSAVTRARLWLVPKADTVFVFLVDAPGAGGFTLARSMAGAAPETLTAEPVRRERDPERLAARLGSDLPLVQRAVGAADETELIRRLSGDPFFATVASALYRNVALAMGRLYIDTAVTPGAEYEYHITFLRAGGDADPRRAPIVARVRVTDSPLPPPAAPRLEARDERALLSWTFPRYAGDPRDRTIAFLVERAEAGREFARASLVPIIRNDALPRMSFADSGLRAGARYRYRLRSIDVAGRHGAPSAEVSYVPLDRTPPAVPVGLALEAGDSRVLVRWDDGTEPDLAGYWVERSLALDRPFTRLTRAPLPVGRPAFVDSAVTGPFQHFYRVVAVDSAGNASRPSPVLDASPTDKRPPATPAALTATVVRRRVSLRWATSASRDLLGYHVYRGTTADRLVRLTAQPIPATQFVDSGFDRHGLAPGGQYVVAVSAVDQSFNESPRRETSVEIPDDEPPRPPASVRALNAAGRAIDLSWSASPSHDAVAYHVTRIGSDGAPRALGRVAAGAGLALRDTAALVHGRWYRYRVIAEDRAGNRSGFTIDSAHYVDGVAPSPTRHATATLRAAGGVALRWERVIDDELRGFHVYRATIPTGAGERLTSSPIADTTFVDPAGRAEHWYVVTAVDRSGNESARSEAVQPMMRTASPVRDGAARAVPDARRRAPAARPDSARTRPRPPAPRVRDTGAR